jgi:5'-3' exonuclease
LLEHWGAEVAWGQEADDALAIRHRELPESSIICTIDKDLKQIPGKHYNFVKEEFDEVTEWSGLFRFYSQTLTGDSTDNIRVSEGLSCKGVGSDTALRLIEGCSSESELFGSCREAYRESWGDGSDARFLLTGRLVKIKQSKDEGLWEFPTK